MFGIWKLLVYRNPLYVREVTRNLRSLSLRQIVRNSLLLHVTLLILVVSSLVQIGRNWQRILHSVPLLVLRFMVLLVVKFMKLRSPLRISRTVGVTWVKEVKIGYVLHCVKMVLARVVLLSRRFQDALALLQNTRRTWMKHRQRPFKVLSWVKVDSRWVLKRTKRPLRYVILPWVLCRPFFCFIMIPILLKIRYSLLLIRRMRIYG